MSKNVLTDLYLVASDSPTEPPGPDGYKSIGYWDVDKGGAHGTDGSKGSFMMALYAKFAEVDSLDNINHVQDVFLTASNNETPTAPDVSKDHNYYNIGYWDVDKGGSVGTNGGKGHFMMGMYIRKNEGGDHYISDIQLTASDNPFPNTLGNNSDYNLLGYWDVDKGGSVGTNGSKGHFMMGLFMQFS